MGGNIKMLAASNLNGRFPLKKTVVNFLIFP